MKKLNIESKYYIEALKEMGHGSSQQAVNITKNDEKNFNSWKDFIMEFGGENEFLLVSGRGKINKIIKTEYIEDLVKEVCKEVQTYEQSVEKYLKKIARGILLANKSNYKDWIREEAAKFIGDCIIVKIKRQKAFLWASDGDKGTENYYTSETEEAFIIMEAKELFERTELGKSQDGEYVKYEEKKKINELTEEDIITKLNIKKESIISIERIN